VGKTTGNKRVKDELMRIYGKGCFFERAKVAERIAAMGGIKTYKSFLNGKRYNGQKLSKQLTLHHLQHRSEGGKTTIENGAVISEDAHQYIQSLPRDEEELINNMLREWKINIIEMRGDGAIIQHQTFTPSASEYITIPLIENTEQDYKKWQNIKEKRKRIQNPSRAQLKKELRQIIEEHDKMNEER
jgi:hypothetical protein